MRKDAFHSLMLEPRTDDPMQEAIDLTNEVKRCIHDIPDPNTIHAGCFQDFLISAIPAPSEPSKFAAKQQAKSVNHLHFWSGWKPYIKCFFTGDAEELDVYKKKKAAMLSDRDTIYREEYVQYEKQYAACLEERRALETEFAQAEPELVAKYFRFCLREDSFSIDYFNEYEIGAVITGYIPDEKLLYVRYRIPNTGEILPLDYFEFDAANQAIIDRQLSTGVAVGFRNDVARKVLLRAAGNIFMSDERQHVGTLILCGYMQSPEADNRMIDVIKLTIPFATIEGRSPQLMNTKEFFRDSFQEERSPGLYEVEPHQLRELLAKPRAPKKTKPAKTKDSEMKVSRNNK